MARIVSPTMPPGAHMLGDVWYHTLSGLTFEWQRTAAGFGVWVQTIIGGPPAVSALAPVTSGTPLCTSSPIAPDNPNPCDLWYHTESGVFFIYYDDGDTRQWVTTQPTKLGDIIVVTGPAGGDLAGSYPNPTIRPDVELTGQPTLENEPTTDEGIANKGYVDDEIAAIEAMLGDYATKTYVDDAIAAIPDPDWADITGKPATFPPTLPIAQSGVTGLVTDLAAKAPLASPTFTGDPKAPTPLAADNDTTIPTTEWVKSRISEIPPPPPNDWASITGKPSTFPPTLPIAQSGVTNLVSDLALKAPLASPALTGTPTAPDLTGGSAGGQLVNKTSLLAALASGASISVGIVPPGSPQPNQMWWNSETGVLYLYYNDGNTSQWVPAVPPGSMQQGFRLLGRVVPTAGQATIDFTGLPPDINDLMFTFDVSPTATAQDLGVRIHNGTSFVATNYIWSNTFTNFSNNASTVTSYGSSGLSLPTAFWLDVPVNTARVHASNGIRGSGKLYNIRDAARAKGFQWMAHYLTDNSVSWLSVVGSGSRAVVETITGVQFLWGATTFAAGGAVSLWGSP